MHRVISFLNGVVLLLAAVLSRAEGATMSAVYAHNALSLTVPYVTERNGEVELTAEVLSPEDRMLGRAVHWERVVRGDAVWNTEIELLETMRLEEVIWQRVRFRLRYADEKEAAVEQILSISEILRRPRMRILAQRSYIAGAKAAVRVIVASGAPDGSAEAMSDGTVRIELLKGDHEPRLLFAGRLDRRGSANAEFRFPAALTGNFPVRFTANTPLGKVETTETVQLQEQTAVLLTTEKPIYQPAQTMHLRALALDRSDHHAVAERKLTFEVEDPRGNKVFRKATETDRFGVAWAEFALADEVNLGAYHVTAKLGATDSNAAELTVKVERYVLPKFRVAIEFTAKDGKEKRDYRPGDHVTGTVKANYFFGKPVANSSLMLKASAMDVELFEAAKEEGRTDEKGEYKFDLTLPKFFAGSGAHRGAAPVVVEATVKDATEHAETRGEPITVSPLPLLITAVPEGGALVRGMENEVYILVSYPDGTPVKADVVVRGGDGVNRATQENGDVLGRVTTDGAGIATVRIEGNATNRTLRLQADDRKGHRANETINLETRAGEDQLLVRTSHAVYKPGDPMRITVLSTRQRGAVFVDLVRNGQTMVTRDADLQNGRAELNLPVTPEMTGTLMVHAYAIGRNGQETVDQRLVFVQPADELHVEATADAPNYLPGGEARVHFHVTNAKGEGVSAALGLEVVDQAVFALAEKQPGFARVFFYLEQELMKPRYEIHSLTGAEIVAPVSGETAEQRDRVARALFAATQTVAPHTLETEAGHELPDAAQGDYLARYRRVLMEYVKNLTPKMKGVRWEGEVPAAFKALRDDEGRAPHDAWGRELRVEPGWMNQNSRWYAVRSAGPDGKFNSADDVTVWLQLRKETVHASEKPLWELTGYSGGQIGLEMEHGRGPDNGLAEIAGTVTDVTGAVVAGAEIRIESEGNHGLRKATTNQEGRFTLKALRPGKYTVRVMARGFETSVRTISMEARDRAVLAVQLTVGSVTETVMVEAAAMAVEAQSGTTAGRAFAPAPLERAKKRGDAMGESKSTPGGHIRSYFPEALYINPEIVTDGLGHANMAIPLADSITTWRMAMFASTQAGALGTGTAELKVFQDFFVDLDLPVTLTLGDRVTIPVAVYNYQGKRGNVTLKLAPEDWFALNGASERTVGVESGEVAAAQFTIEAKRIGKFRLTVTGRMDGGSEREDTIVREIEVVPNGEAKETVFNGRLDTSERQTVRFPENAIPDASKIFVRLYPGPLSQVIEGMDGILRMPYGCFEQTSSSTYPNVLALDYMKRMKKLTPEVHAKAEGFIATGYQRLLTFEVPGGGFSWFGNAPANKILTAYGLMEFQDLARVYDVDPRVMERTSEWLAGQQMKDGSWAPDTQFINEGATNRFNTDVLRITAYIALALETAKYKGDAVERARKYIETHFSGKDDAYTLAVVANFALANDRKSQPAERALELLRDAATQKGEFAWWTATETGVYGSGESAAVETTGLVVQAMMKAGTSPELVRKALAWITSRKNGQGNWGTTQATIMALRALVDASEKSGADAHGTVEVLLNGTKVESLEVTNENNDLLHQFVLPRVSVAGDNEVELRFTGAGGMAYQIAGQYFLPWRAAGDREPLAIEVKYDRTRLAQDEVAKATATIRNNTDGTAKMVMVDLGIPPGFELESEDLQEIVEKTATAKSGRLEKFSMTATQAILYFDSIAPRDLFEVRYRLKAKYPIRANGFASQVYEYYNPEVRATARPTQFEVTAR
jgi:hypothetical protein